jgi:uncharacterized sporulation protein YeaH/YhbH (DUF444 family)
MTETTELTLQELKEVNAKLKEELEKAKVEAENRELRKEIDRLRRGDECVPYIYTPDYTYNPKPWDNVTLCNNKY